MAVVVGFVLADVAVELGRCTGVNQSHPFQPEFNSITVWGWWAFYAVQSTYMTFEVKARSRSQEVCISRFIRDAQVDSQVFQLWRVRLQTIALFLLVVAFVHGLVS